MREFSVCGTMAALMYTIYFKSNDEQADIGADHSRGNHSIQDVSIQRYPLVVQNLRKERDFIGQLRVGKGGQGDIIRWG